MKLNGWTPPHDTWSLSRLCEKKVAALMVTKHSHAWSALYFGAVLQGAADNIKAVHFPFPKRGQRSAAADKLMRKCSSQKMTLFVAREMIEIQDSTLIDRVKASPSHHCAFTRIIWCVGCENGFPLCRCIVRSHYLAGPIITRLAAGSNCKALCVRPCASFYFAKEQYKNVTNSICLIPRRP